MQISDIITTVAAKSGIEAAVAEHAVGNILSVLQHEVEGTHVQQLFAKVPGAAALAQQYNVMAPAAAIPGTSAGGGLMGLLTSVVGSVLGAKSQPVMNGISRMEQSGLSLAQIEQVGATLMAEVRSLGGGNLVSTILAAAPGLASYLGGGASAPSGTPATAVPAA